MKFCAKCGTQMADEAEKCPQCNFPVFDPLNTDPYQQYPSKKKFNKLFVIIPLIVIITALITFAVIYFVSPIGSNIEEPSTDNSIAENIEEGFENEPIEENLTTENVEENSEIKPTDDVCPAQDYGNHSWSAATCINPSHCYYCGVYKNDELGHHDFHYDEEIDEIVCWNCNMIKDE